jgi:hypothetical protein
LVGTIGELPVITSGWRVECRGSFLQRSIEQRKMGSTRVAK